MPRMTDVDVDYISLVNKGANKQKIQIYKSDDYEPETSNDNEEIEEVTGFFNAIKSFFTGEEVKKVDKKAVKSFNDRIVTREVMDNIWRVNDTLVSTMRDILNSPDIKDKEEALNATIDQHGTYLKSKVKGVNKIKKAEEFFKEEGGNEDMKKEDLQEVIKEAIEPLTERLEKIEKEEEEGQGEEEKQEDTKDSTKDKIKEAIKEAIEPLEERIKRLEDTKGISKQLEDEEEPVKKSKSVFADLDIF